MANVVHGELKFNASSIGQVSDLMAILVSNGYSVEIIPKTQEKEIVVIVMTEVKKYV